MKLLILKQNVTDLDTLNKGLEIAKQKALTIGLNLEFLFADTTKQFSSVPTFASSVSVKGYTVNGVEIFQEGKLTNIPFDLVVLVYDWTKIIPQPTNPSESGLAISIPIQWYVTYPEVFAEFLLHELSHYFFQSTGKPDLTHFKYDPMWNKQFNNKSNIDYYLFLIKPFMQPIVTLTRNNDDGIQTLGTLNTENFTCKTLERPFKNNTPFISSIPKGTYLCKYTWSWKFLKYTYEIQNVPNRTGIRIHSANFYSQLLGCIALGDTYKDINSDGKLDILNSRITISNFEQIMNKKDFSLQII